MVRPAARTANALCDSDVLPVSLPHNDVIKPMPMLGAKMHPRRHVAEGEAEDGISDEEFMRSTSLQQLEAVVIPAANSVSLQYFFCGA